MSNSLTIILLHLIHRVLHPKIQDEIYIDDVSIWSDVYNLSFGQGGLSLMEFKVSIGINALIWRL